VMNRNGWVKGRERGINTIGRALAQLGTKSIPYLNNIPTIVYFYLWQLPNPVTSS